MDSSVHGRVCEMFVSCSCSKYFCGLLALNYDVAVEVKLIIISKLKQPCYLPTVHGGKYYTLMDLPVHGGAFFSLDKLIWVLFQQYIVLYLQTIHHKS